MSFTYQHIRDRVKQTVIENPMICVPPHSLEWMLRHIGNLAPGSIFLELGTFIGGTTRAVAVANPDITVHTIDLNDFSPLNPDFSTVKMIMEQIKDRYNLPDLVPEDLYDLQQMHIEDLPNVKSHTGHSRSLKIQNVDAVFIDADHDVAQVYADLSYAWEILNDDGYIFCDDINSTGVFNAVNMFSLIHDVEMHLYCKTGMIQKKLPLPGFLKQTDGISLFTPFS